MGKSVAEMEERRKMLAAERQKRWREKNKSLAEFRSLKANAKRFAEVGTADDLKEMIAYFEQKLTQKHS